MPSVEVRGTRVNTPIRDELIKLVRRSNVIPKPTYIFREKHFQRCASTLLNNFLIITTIPKTNKDIQKDGQNLSSLPTNGEMIDLSTTRAIFE